MSGEMQTARQWVAKAANDLLCADNNLRADEVPLDTVCFHCQQAVEKLLKACLAANGQLPSRTHDLLALLESVLAFHPGAEELRETLALLMPFSVEIRYPDDGFAPSEADAVEARDAAESVLGWFKAALAPLWDN